MAKKSELSEKQLRDAERWSWVTSVMGAVCAIAAVVTHERQWPHWLAFSLVFAALGGFWRRKRLTRKLS